MHRVLGIEQLARNVELFARQKVGVAIKVRAFLGVPEVAMSGLIIIVLVDLLLAIISMTPARDCLLDYFNDFKFY